MGSYTQLEFDPRTVVYTILGALLVSWLAIRLLKKSIDLDGPANPSWLTGSGFEANESNIKTQEVLTENYGRTVKIYGPLGTEAIFTSDPIAIQSISKDLSRYERGKATVIVKALLGGGLLSMWGPDHRAHRKILNPVFVPKHLRDQMKIFDDIALQACDAINHEEGVERGQTFECDIYRYMNSSALELVGQAGLGYSFGSFTGKRDEYSAAVKHLLPALVMARPWLPFVFMFENFGTARFRDWVVRMAPSKVVQNLRELIRIQHDQAHEIWSARKSLLSSGQSLESITGSGKDLLTVLMAANEKLSQDSQMTAEDMVGHMNTFIMAGHETTSSAITRALDVLATRPELQDRLRVELTTFMAETSAEDIKRDKIDTLPYLDAICREVLRFAPPVAMYSRECSKDSILPLKFPVNTSSGPQTSLFVPKGTMIGIGIYAINRDKEIWGSDANHFDPERWLDGRASSAEGSPGVYSHMLSFSSGPAACIGFKFAVLEIKILLVRLITRYRFEPSGKEFIWMLSGTQAPYSLEDAKKPMFERKGQLLMKMTAL